MFFKKLMKYKQETVLNKAPDFLSFSRYKYLNKLAAMSIYN